MMTEAPKRIYIHHADQIKSDGAQALVFKSTAPVNFQASQTEYVRADLIPAVAVKPLEWELNSSGRWVSNKGAYVIQHVSEPMSDINTGDSLTFCLMRPGKENLFLARLDAAMDAANAGHRAQILAAIGVE